MTKPAIFVPVPGSETYYGYPFTTMNRHAVFSAFPCPTEKAHKKRRPQRSAVSAFLCVLIDVLARPHGEDGALDERVQIPAEHLSAALDDLREQPAANFCPCNFFLTDLTSKVVHALARAHEATAPIRPVSSSAAKRTFSIISCCGSGRPSKCRPVAVAGGRADQALIQSLFPHDLLRFDAVFVGIHLKVEVVQEAYGLPEVGLVAVAKLICVPAHHVADDLAVLEMKFTLVCTC